MVGNDHVAKRKTLRYGKNHPFEAYEARHSYVEILNQQPMPKGRYASPIGSSSQTRRWWA